MLQCTRLHFHPPSAVFQRFLKYYLIPYYNNNTPLPTNPRIPHKLFISHFPTESPRRTSANPPILPKHQRAHTQFMPHQPPSYILLQFYPREHLSLL